jgi:hypothetical protein
MLALLAIYPRLFEGTTALDNFALSCVGCNGHKCHETQALNPATNGVASFFHPRRQLWFVPFISNEDYPLQGG